jgi:hypothetical protein
VPGCAPNPPATSLDTLGPIPIGLGAAADLFCAAKAAGGASPRTVEWYRMILVRAVRRTAIEEAELRAGPATGELQPLVVVTDNGPA